MPVRNRLYFALMALCLPSFVLSWAPARCRARGALRAGGSGERGLRDGWARPGCAQGLGPAEGAGTRAGGRGGGGRRRRDRYRTGVARGAARQGHARPDRRRLLGPGPAAGAFAAGALVLGRVLLPCPPPERRLHDRLPAWPPIRRRTAAR